MDINPIGNIFNKTKAKLGAQNVEHTPQSTEPAKKQDFSHQKMLNEMLALIASCPMDSRLKMILRMRIWGKSPIAFAPMSHLAIAENLKCRIKDVQRWEEDALYNVSQYLNKDGIVTISEKFLRDGNLKDILEEKKRIIA